MHHLKKGRKFGRTRSQRKSLLRNLAFSLVMKERIKTGEAKAKELKPRVEKLLTLAKRDTVQTRRLLIQRIPEQAVHKLITTIAPRYKGRDGGYIRILKLGVRRSDSAREAIIEFVK